MQWPVVRFHSLTDSSLLAESKSMGSTGLTLTSFTAFPCPASVYAWRATVSEAAHNGHDAARRTNVTSRLLQSITRMSPRKPAAMNNGAPVAGSTVQAQA